MKKTLTILWAVMAIAVIQAQTNSQFLRPVELVSQYKSEQQGEFERMPFFSAWTTERNFDPALGTVKTARINQEQLQLLVATAPAQLALQLPQPGGDMIELELVKVNLLSSDFSVIESARNAPVQVDPGVHYRGIVKGDPESIAAISFFDHDVMGMLSSPAVGNLVLGKMESAEKDGEALYIVYKDDGLHANLGFYCGVDEDDAPGYAPEELHGSIDERSAGDCVRIYFEVDNDIVVNKGGVTGATNYVTGIFNQVATLYANENVSVVISQIFAWSTASPYNSTSSAGMLTQFQNYRTTFNGDLGQLLSFKASGGIAVLAGLCHPYNLAKLSFASIGASYANVPVYSFTVLVITHELGHLLGSHHTHACVWNGNNTAIDGCAGFSEGTCAVAPIPTGGGTIMSYCHITSTGINLSKGFGSQPGNVIRNRIANATCTTACSTGGGGGGGGTGGGDDTCDDYRVFMTLTLDDYGTETSWKIKPSGDTTVLFSGGPYPKGLAGTTVRDTFCLPQGCYDLVVMDSYGDGMCCAYGQGSYSLTDEDGNVLANGGSFGFEDMKNTCLPFDDGGSNTTCVTVNFNDYAINPFGAGNDFGTYQLLNGGVVLKVQNNAWKNIALNYTVTPNTIMEFEFGSTLEGEIHGIGFDNDDLLSYNTTFKLHGNQNWGILNYDNYPGGSIWLKYTIPVGQFFTGAFSRLVFAADNDSGNYSGNSYFRYIKIYEGANGCNGNLAEGEGAQQLLVEESAGALLLSPNPTRDALQVTFEGWEGPVQLRVYNAFGQLVQQQAAGVLEGIFTETLYLGNLPQGAYYLQADNGQEVQSSKFIISKN